MADKPDRDYLVSLLAGLDPKPAPNNHFGSLLNSSPPSPGYTLLSEALGMAPPTLSSSNSLGSLFGGSPPTTTSLPDVAPRPNSLASALWPNLPLSSPTYPAPRPVSALPVAPATTKRKGFFSFHYADIMRVNNVRKSREFKGKARKLVYDFCDGSLWEATRRTNPEGLKRLIAGGMAGTSTVCVLIGSETWIRPWVRYEIARAVAENKGLLAIHINSIRRHDLHRQADSHGLNPLDFVGVYAAADGRFFIYEKNYVVINRLTGAGEFQWQPFGLHKAAVPLPKYMTAPAVGYVRPLSAWTPVYDYALDQGADNLGAWIDTAAKRVGR